MELGSGVALLAVWMSMLVKVLALMVSLLLPDVVQVLERAEVPHQEAQGLGATLQAAGVLMQVMV